MPPSLLPTHTRVRWGKHVVEEGGVDQSVAPSPTPPAAEERKREKAREKERKKGMVEDWERIENR